MRMGRRLNIIQDQRDSYWLVTECELPGKQAFEIECMHFNNLARRKCKPLLDELRLLDSATCE